MQGALTAYEQADLDAAKATIASGYAALACQPSVVPTDALLELYRIDGLIALSLGDQRALVYATIRAVSAQHVGGRPPDRYGPDLQAQYDTWATRMAGDLVQVTVSDGGTAWVDGRTVDRAHPLTVVSGEHLVQLPVAPPAAPGAVPGAVRSEVRELTADAALTTGVALGASPEPVPPTPTPTPSPRPSPVPEPEPHASAARRHPIGFAIGSGASAALAGFAIASAYRSDRAFRASPYLAGQFGTCARGEPCYADARAQAIRSDARRIDAGYAVGYGLSAVSSGLLVVTVIGFPGR